MVTEMIAPSVLNRTGGTQPRAQLDEMTIAEYADAMTSGDIFPPVVAFYDGNTWWLADGFPSLTKPRFGPRVAYGNWTIIEHPLFPGGLPVRNDCLGGVR